MTFSPANAKSAFLTTTRNFSEQKDIKVTLDDAYANIANAVNVRDISTYDVTELQNGQQFFVSGDATKKRLCFRKVFEIGAIAAGATLNVAHGLTGVTEYTRIYGTCKTAVVDYRPIPWTSATLITDQIQIRIVGVNIEIVNGATAPAITSGIVVLEFLKN